MRTALKRPKSAVIWATYGPYHLARLRGLRDETPGEVVPLQIHGRERGARPWGTESDGVITIAEHVETPVRQVTTKLREVLEREQPDVVISCGYGHRAMRAAAFWARRNRKASVLMHESTSSDRSRKWWRERPKRELVRRLYDTAICGGIAHRAYLEELGIPRERIWFPYDVVDNDYFERTVAELRADGAAHVNLTGRPYFLFVGRFIWKKNLSMLLHAYRAYVDQTSSPWPLALVGDGTDREELRRLADELRLDDVHWFPMVDQEGVCNFLAHAGSLVLPSLAEPWGLVVNEAAAAGLPVIVTDRAGCVPELVREGENGFLLDPEQVDSIASALSQMSSVSQEARERMGERSRELVQGLTPSAFGKALSECMDAALAIRAGETHVTR